MPDDGLAAPTLLGPFHTTVGGIPAVVQGASAEQDQYQRARQGTDVAAGSQRSYQRLGGQPVEVAHADLPAAQVFEAHPRVEDALGTADVGVEAMPLLPGRVSPAGFDGEPGPQGPLAEV